MPMGCKERFDLDFIHYVATYNILRRKKLLEKLNSFEGKKKVYRIINDKDIETFLEDINGCFS